MCELGWKAGGAGMESEILPDYSESNRREDGRDSRKAPPKAQEGTEERYARPTCRIESPKAESGNPYKVLGVEPGASEEEIREARQRKLAEAKGNKERTKDVEEAYRKLMKEQREKQEDEPMEDMDDGIQNLLNALGGHRGGRPARQQRPKLKPMQYALEVTLDQIHSGATEQMRLTRMRLCPLCKGYSFRTSLCRMGCKPGGSAATCETCGGRKFVFKAVQMGPGMYARTQAPCDDCHGRQRPDEVGTGDKMKEEDRCPTCKGEKIAEDKKEFNVKLDAGVPENHVYTFEGEGNQVVRSSTSP